MGQAVPKRTWRCQKDLCLAKSTKEKHLILYITVLDYSLGALVGQEYVENKENALHYLSRTLIGPEERYSY